MRVQIKGCVRCGGNHDMDIALIDPPTPAALGCTHHGVCPKSGKPVLVRIVGDKVADPFEWKGPTVDRGKRAVLEMMGP